MIEQNLRNLTNFFEKYKVKMVLSPSSAQENLPALMENLLSINENDKNAVIDSLTNLRIALSKLSAQNIYSLLTNPILEGFIRSARLVY